MTASTPASSTATADLAGVAKEAAACLESAAAHNRSKGRTVLAHDQQDRADRLRLALHASQPVAAAPSATADLPQMSWLDAPLDIASDQASVWAKGWNAARAALQQRQGPAPDPLNIGYGMPEPDRTNINAARAKARELVAASQPVAAAPAAQAATDEQSKQSFDARFSIDSHFGWKPLDYWQGGWDAACAALQQRQAPARCPHCDGTGSVHRPDGEYMGECDCEAEAAPMASAEPTEDPNWMGKIPHAFQGHGVAQAAPAPADSVPVSALEAYRDKWLINDPLARSALDAVIDGQAIAPAPVAAVPVAWIRTTDITELTDSEPETEGWTPLFAAPVASQPAQSEQTQQSDRDSALRAEPAGQHDACFHGTIDAGEYNRETGMMRVTVKLPFVGLPEELLTINAAVSIAPGGRASQPAGGEEAENSQSAPTSAPGDAGQRDGKAAAANPGGQCETCNGSRVDPGGLPMCRDCAPASAPFADFLNKPEAVPQIDCSVVNAYADKHRLHFSGLCAMVREACRAAAVGTGEVADGAALLAEIFNRLTQKQKLAVPQVIAGRIGEYMVRNGYRIVFGRWYLQAEPDRAASKGSAYLTDPSTQQENDK